MREHVLLSAMFALILIVVASAPSVAEAQGRGVRRGSPYTAMGNVERRGPDYIVRSGRVSRTITGQDFSKYVGNKVKARGTLRHSERSPGRVLEVDRIEEFGYPREYRRDRGFRQDERQNHNR